MAEDTRLAELASLQDDTRVAELASLLEIEAEEARRALAEAGGDLAAAVEVVRSWAVPPETPAGRRSLGPAAAGEQRHEWPGGASVLAADFQHRLGGEPPAREADGARELRALQRGVPPRDFLPLLCELARSGGRASAGSIMDRASTAASLGDVFLQSSASWTSAKSPPGPEGLQGLPDREALILEGAARLGERLGSMGLCAMEIADDGNCLFRACAAQLYRAPAGAPAGAHHPLVRHRAVAELHLCRERYSHFFSSDDEFLSYLAEMSTLGTWGDELVLRAIADSYDVTVHVVTSSEENWYLVYSPELEGREDACRPRRHIFLTYLSPIHYNGFEERPLEAKDVRVHVSA